ncbi:MAG: hypothetical protein QG608_2847 [Actinomycetota bacterium]|nr:hypothetical protein [Actinomycetota bacterium]
MVNSDGLRRILSENSADFQEGTADDSLMSTTGAIDVLPTQRRSGWSGSRQERRAGGRHQAVEEEAPPPDRPAFPRVPSPRSAVRDEGTRAAEVLETIPTGLGLLEPAGQNAFQDPPRVSQIQGLPPQGTSSQKVEDPPARFAPSPPGFVPFASASIQDLRGPTAFPTPVSQAPAAPAPFPPRPPASAPPSGLFPRETTGERPREMTRDLRPAPFSSSSTPDVMTPFGRAGSPDLSAEERADGLPSNDVLPNRVPTRWGLKDRALDLVDRARSVLRPDRDEYDEEDGEGRGYLA